ncbi:MAG: hypothetical protein U1F47_02240 [Hyphomicrobiales bacterium]
MTNFALARKGMIESQVRPNGVTDHRIIDSMSRIARERFVPESRRPIAYAADEDIEIAPGRYLIEAMAFAKMLQLAEIRPASSPPCRGWNRLWQRSLVRSCSQEW